MTKPVNSTHAEIAATIEDAFKAAQTANCYQILGVDSNATVADIRAAYYRLAARLHPDLHHYWMPDALARKLTSLFSTVVAAYRLLSDPSRRSEYDRNLRSGRKRLGTDSRAQTRPPEYDVDNPVARRFFLLGREALRDRDPKSAAISLRFALSLEPRNQTILRECERADALAARQLSLRRDTPPSRR